MTFFVSLFVATVLIASSSTVSQQSPSLIWPKPIPSSHRESLIEKYLKQNGKDTIPEVIVCLSGHNKKFEDTFEGEQSTFQLAGRVLNMLNQRRYIFILKFKIIINPDTPNWATYDNDDDTISLSPNKNCDYFIDFKYSRQYVGGLATHHNIMINLSYVKSAQICYTTLLHEIGHIFTMPDDYNNYESMMSDGNGGFKNQVIFRDDVDKLYKAQFKYYLYQMPYGFYYNMFTDDWGRPIVESYKRKKKQQYNNQQDKNQQDKKVKNEQNTDFKNIDNNIKELEDLVAKLKKLWNIFNKQ